MKQFKRIISIFLTLACVLMLAACGSDGSGATLQYPIDAEPECLDPQIAEGAEAKTVVLNCFEGLVRHSSDGSIVPGVAESWSYNSSTLTYTFKLRENSKWVIMKKAFTSILGDGFGETFDNRVTAADFVFALRRAVSPETGAPEALSLAPIKNAKAIISGKKSASQLGVKAVGDYTLEITLESAVDENSFLSLLTKSICMPCNEEFFNATKGRYGLSYSTLMCNGPFYLSYWLEESSLTLKNNDEYTGQSAAKPASVTLVVDNDYSSRLELLLDSTYCAAQLGTLEPNSDDFNVTKNYDTVWALCFNCSSSSLSNVSLRRALCTAVDYDSLSLESDDMQKTYSIIPPSCFVGEGFDLNSEAVKILGYDEQKSAAYWEKSSQKLGGTVKLEVLCLPEHENAMRRMIQGWQKITGLGASFSVTVLERGELNERVESGDYQIALTSLNAGVTSAADYLSSLSTGGSRNIFAYKNSSFDSAVKNLKALDGTQLVKACRDAEGKLLTDAAALPLFVTPSYFALGEGISGVSVDSETSAVNFVFALAN